MNPSPRKNHAYGINLAVAEVLTEERKARGFTNESLAAVLPMSLSSVQRYLTGKAAIDVEALSTICKALGASEIDVIKRAEARVNPSPPAPEPPKSNVKKASGA